MSGGGFVGGNQSLSEEKMDQFNDGCVSQLAKMWEKLDKDSSSPYPCMLTANLIRQISIFIF